MITDNLTRRDWWTWSGLTYAEPAATSEEATRRLIVNLTFTVYWLLIFEGALRKWVLPQASEVIFFIRDPFVLLIYYLAFKHRLWPQRSTMLWLGLGLAGLFVPLLFIQLMAYDFSPLISAYGWRNYFFYLPLAFIIGYNFRGEDLARLMRQTLIIAIPLAMLTFYQFLSPPDAFINKTYTKDALIFTVAGDIVRTYGTFTFTLGQVLFVASTIAMLVGAWIIPKQSRPLGLWLLLLATAGVITSFAVNGSRSIFFYTAFIFASAILSGLIMYRPQVRLRALVLPIVVGIAGAIIFINVFSTSWHAIEQRSATAEAMEGSPIVRALKGFDISEYLGDDTPLIGYGVGYGTGGGAKLATGQIKLILAENDWHRIMLESGLVFGLLYIAYRVLFTLWLFVEAMNATRRANNPLPLLLFGFIGIVILDGQMTMQGTVNGYAWLFAGFVMAANRLGRRSDSETNPWA